MPISLILVDELMKQLAREVLDLTAAHIKPGVTTDELDAICHQACVDRDSYPSPLNYNAFPKSVCTSVNEVICHVSCFCPCNQTVLIYRVSQINVL